MARATRRKSTQRSRWDCARTLPLFANKTHMQSVDTSVPVQKTGHNGKQPSQHKMTYKILSGFFMFIQLPPCNKEEEDEEEHGDIQDALGKHACCIRHEAITRVRSVTRGGLLLSAQTRVFLRKLACIHVTNTQRECGGWMRGRTGRVRRTPCSWVRISFGVDRHGRCCWRRRSWVSTWRCGWRSGRCGHACARRPLVYK